jgi:hypothetical protein
MKLKLAGSPVRSMKRYTLICEISTFTKRSELERLCCVSSEVIICL